MSGHIFLGKMVVAIIAFFLPGIAIGAADFPQRPIQILVGWPVGAMNDTIDRVIAQSLQRILKQPIIIQNVPGGSGALVLGRIKTEKPDGYTLFQTGTTMYAKIPHMRTTPYDPLKDFAYLAQYATFKYLLEDRPDSPWKNFEELIQYVKKNPKKVKYSSPGIGSGNHIMMEYLAMRENLQWIHVPYNSQAEAVTSLLGGHVEISPGTLGVEIDQIREGRIRALLCLNSKRLTDFPDVPTILEKGYDFSAYNAACFSVPVNTPKDIQQKLEEALLQSFKDPPVIEVIGKLNMVYDPLGGEAVAAMVAKDHQVFGEIAKKIGIGIYKK